MQTATNPQTGERVQLNNGAWEPVKTATNPQTGEKVEFLGGAWQPVANARPTQQPLPQEPAKAGRVASAIGGVSQGATFGFGDEIEAGLASLIPIDKMVNLDGSADIRFGQYGHNLAEVRKRNALQKDSNPKTFFAGELGGAVGTGGAGVTKLGLYKGGAAAGGAYGVGSAEGGLKERGKGGAAGAALGLLGAGAAKHVVGPLAGALATRAKSTISRSIEKAANGQAKNMTKGQRKAYAIIRRNLKEQGFKPEDFADKIAVLESKGADDQFVFEVFEHIGENQAKGVATTGRKSAMEGVAKVRARQTLQHAKIDAELSAALGDDGTNFLTKSKSIEAAKKKADPIYKQFRSLQGTPKEEVAAMLGDDFDSVFSQASKSAARRDAEIVAGGDTISPDVLDRMRRALAERAQTARRAGDATDYGDFKALEGRFKAYLDEQYPVVYEAARKAFAGPAAQADALEMGESLIRSTANRRAPEEVAELVANMAPDELSAFRLGTARAMRVEMGKGNAGVIGDKAFGDPGNLVKRIFNNREKQDVIKAAFGDEDKFNRFAKAMVKLDNQAQSFNAVNVQRAGSQTAAREAARSNVGELTDIGTDLLESKGGNVFAVKRLAQRLLPKSDESVQDEMAQFLFSKADDELPALKKMLSRMTQGERIDYVRSQTKKGVEAIGQQSAIPALGNTE